MHCHLLENKLLFLKHIESIIFYTTDQFKQLFTNNPDYIKKYYEGAKILYSLLCKYMNLL